MHVIAFSAHLGKDKSYYSLSVTTFMVYDQIFATQKHRIYKLAMWSLLASFVLFISFHIESMNQKFVVGAVGPFPLQPIMYTAGWKNQKF